MFKSTRKVLALILSGPIFIGALALLMAGGAALIISASIEDRLKPPQ